MKKISNIPLTESNRSRDLKKIRSLIAKYKNKSLDSSSTTLEGRILKTLNLNKVDIKNTDFQITENE